MTDAYNHHEQPPKRHPVNPIEAMLWALGIAIVVSAVIACLVGCGNEAAIEAASRNAIEADAEANAMIGLSNRMTRLETTIGTIQTTIGGGVDSIALSLAIVGLVASPFAGAWYYERFRRPKRLKETDRRRGERRKPPPREWLSPENERRAGPDRRRK